MLISIHALREESDYMDGINSCAAPLFQSTLSVRRATAVPAGMLGIVSISIHALREESDYSPTKPVRQPSDFNPRSP